MKTKPPSLFTWLVIHPSGAIIAQDSPERPAGAVCGLRWGVPEPDEAAIHGIVVESVDAPEISPCIHSDIV